MGVRMRRSEPRSWNLIIAGEFALDADTLQVSVQSGVVTLTGIVERTDIALRLVARVRHAEGVVATRDRLSVGEVVDASGPASDPRPTATHG
jgi:BON domain